MRLLVEQFPREPGDAEVLPRPGLLLQPQETWAALGPARPQLRVSETLGRWLDAHRRELLPPLLHGGVHVSGHTATVETPGLLTDPEALRTLLGQLAELAKLLSLR